MEGGIKIGKLFGIKITLDWSWFFIFALFSLAFRDYFIENAQLNSVAGWIAGCVMAMAVFASILFHEMAHSLVAKNFFGVSVNEIRLFILGGLAMLGRNPKTAKGEFCIFSAGPASSLFLAVFFWGLALVNKNEVLVLAFGYLSVINLALFLFNLLPAYPLDGGRILKALLWRHWENELRAEEVSLLNGKLFGTLIIAVGIFEVLFQQNLSGVWLIFVGWFIRSLAGIGYKQLKLRKEFKDSNAAD